ncbi:cell division protein SepF [Schinkia azotoformans]|uniref:cell division protein SepF n=1 Tax=Schinkia azotoformans TaxID=1454 RepID=UPI002DBFC51C|nr:cell division protein SepF [Schinkia azotoformans]MEC1715378.1 cell division protein SepF [Schinkia azotoformans]MEC1740872.1 cell division protein SepF [Schinkia azotoformans]MEC1746622.1 cell division protein SepF [Schinkia azotoformans]MEC1757746.1 cell division protein SepF [Schinkia azotoformans]MEC1767829.1 cell division protein SepF [Schinkia azotoformans]
MSIKSKFRTFFALDDEEEYIEEQSLMEEEYEVPKRVTRSSKQNVVSLQSIQQSSKVILCEPRIYDEVQEIADHLKNRKTVVINLQRVTTDQGMRIVDFLSGTVYAIGGDINKLGANTFICTPENVDITGSISDMAEEMGSIEDRW